MKIVSFIIEMILGVIPATLFVPLALLGSMFSTVGTSKGLMWFFHPYGIMGFFGLAGTVGLWFVVPQNAFRSNFKPDKVHQTLLTLGALSVIPFIVVMSFYKNDDISSFMFLLVGPLVVSIKYLLQAFKNRYLTI